MTTIPTIPAGSVVTHRIEAFGFTSYERDRATRQDGERLFTAHLGPNSAMEWNGDSFACTSSTGIVHTIVANDDAEVLAYMTGSGALAEEQRG